MTHPNDPSPWAEGKLPGERTLPDRAPEPFDLHALRERIEALRRATLSDLDQSAFSPESVLHVNLAMNALETARLHVEAARLVRRVTPITRQSAPAFARAVAILGSEDKAREWLERPHGGLGGATPLALLETLSGALRVEDALNHLSEGHFG
ncbi:MAG: DUF2384 domain-containing protein [Coriobacteriia bacterium]|nr:DUF2384 domain-containing protein [Coriobacteriia bacterium]